jgi:hypothetical protein
MLRAFVLSARHLNWPESGLNLMSLRSRLAVSSFSVMAVLLARPYAQAPHEQAGAVSDKGRRGAKVEIIPPPFDNLAKGVFCLFEPSAERQIIGLPEYRDMVHGFPLFNSRICYGLFQPVIGPY